jgi:16S rRNA (cytosine1402-N4)-methyltransferase
MISGRVESELDLRRPWRGWVSDKKGDVERSERGEEDAAAGKTEPGITESPGHESVMTAEVVALLKPRPGGIYVDATLGGGGHAEAILEASAPSGRVIGLDRDRLALGEARRRLARFGDRVRLVQGSFADLSRLLLREGAREVNGILADLGLSSLQLADPTRGFSFRAEGPLDMRFDQDEEETAADLVNRLTERELADLLFAYGGERRSRAIARKVVARRPLQTTGELRQVIRSVVGPSRQGGIDPATRTFQALRIAVNRELAALDSLLAAGPELLAGDGRLVILSYHSLEDRAVKLAFRQRAASGAFQLLTRKPLRPSPEELRRNRRARSARLRGLARRAA